MPYRLLCVIERFSKKGKFVSVEGNVHDKLLLFNVMVDICEVHSTRVHQIPYQEHTVGLIHRDVLTARYSQSVLL